MAWENLDIIVDAFEVDPAPAALPAGTVSNCSNVDFFAGRARALGLLSPRKAMTQNPVAMQAFATTEAAFVGLFGSLMQAWTAADTLINIAPTTGLTGAAYWDTTEFGGWCVVTNDTVGQLPHAISVAQAAASGKLSPLPGWPATWECTIVGTHRNVLWAGDTIESGTAHPNRVRWSASAISGGLPATWIPAPENDAGQNDLGIAGGRVTCFAAVGDVMFCGGPGSLWAARWVGGAYVYKFSQIQGQQGPRGQNCMVSMGDRGIMLTQTDCFVFDETTLTSISTRRVGKIINSMVAPQMMWIPSQRQLIIAYSLPGESAGLNHSLIWDRDSNTWGKRDHVSTPFTTIGAIINPAPGAVTTWDAITTTWETDFTIWSKSYEVNPLYAGVNASFIYSAGPEFYNWFLERQNMPAPDGNEIRVISLELDAEADPGSVVRMRMGSSNFSGELPTWGPIKSYTVGIDRLRHDDLQQGKFFSWQLQGTGAFKLTYARIYYNGREIRP